MGIDTILKIIDSLSARGFDAVRWQANRHIVKAQLEEWHTSNAMESEKIAALDEVLGEIDASSTEIARKP